MAKKQRIGLYVGIPAAVVAIAIIVGLVIASKNKVVPDTGGEDVSNTSTQTTTGDKLKASDLTKVDVKVEYGDYDGMLSLAKDIQNGYATGKVVKIEGLVSHPMSSYSIVEANEDGTEKIGTQFVIEGETGYPNDKDRIVITGKVVELSPLVYVIKTLPEYVVVK